MLDIIVPIYAEQPVGWVPRGAVGPCGGLLTARPVHDPLQSKHGIRTFQDAVDQQGLRVTRRYP